MHPHGVVSAIELLHRTAPVDTERLDLTRPPLKLRILVQLCPVKVISVAEHIVVEGAKRLEERFIDVVSLVARTHRRLLPVDWVRVDAVAAVLEQVSEQIGALANKDLLQFELQLRLTSGLVHEALHVLRHRPVQTLSQRDAQLTLE